jgi:hypothetical protein
MHLESLNLTLKSQSSKRDEWEGVCSAYKDVRMSKVQERCLRADQALFIEPLQRIEPLDSAMGSAHDNWTRRSGWLDAPVPASGPRICTACHLFKPTSLDLNGHLASQRLSQTRPDAPTQSTWRCLTRRLIEYSKVPQSNFDDLTRARV